MEEAAIKKLLTCNEQMEDTEPTKRKIDEIKDKTKIDDLTEGYNPSKRSKFDEDLPPLEEFAMEGLLSINTDISLNNRFNDLNELASIAELHETEIENMIGEFNVDELINYQQCQIVTKGKIDPGTDFFRIIGLVDNYEIFSINYKKNESDSEPKFEIKLIKHFLGSERKTTTDHVATTFQLSAFAKSPPEMWDKFDDELLIDIYRQLENLANVTFCNGPQHILKNIEAACANLYIYLDI